MTTLLALSTILAGCAGGSAPALGTDETSVAPAPTFSDETGAIRGTVVDDSQLPVEDADVALIELNLATKTDAGGAFTLNHVPPGTYSLTVQRLGFESDGRRVTVSAGEIAPVRFVLIPQAVIDAHPSTLVWNGHIQCSVALYPGVPVYAPGLIVGWVTGANACGIICIVACLPAFGNNAFDHEFAPTQKDIREVFLEMEWRSTQAAGSALRVGIEHPSFVNDDKGDYGGVGGRSPLVLYVNETVMAKVAEGTNADCVASKCKFYTRVFAEAETTRVTSPVEPPDVPLVGKPSRKIDAGATLDQTFTQYFTSFHGQLKPAGFTTLADA